MKKKVVLLLISIFSVIIAIVAVRGVYNLYAGVRRSKQTYCNVDSDCVRKTYYHSACGNWSSCFNKNEEPTDDLEGNLEAFCNSPPTGCKCVENTCIGTHGDLD